MKSARPGFAPSRQNSFGRYTCGIPMRSLLSLLLFLPLLLCAEEADLILHHGKIVTVDAAFSIGEAMAVKDGRVLAVGSEAAILPLKSEKTQVIDLGGRMVIPGLIDSHTHPTGAS